MQTALFLQDWLSRCWTLRTWTHPCLYAVLLAWELLQRFSRAPARVFGGVETLEIQGLEAGNVPELRICLAGFGGRIKLNASLLGFQVEFNCEFQWFQMHAQSLFLFMVVSQSVNNMHCPIDRNILH